MNRTLIKQALTESGGGQTVTVCGWVRTRRDSKGGFSFIEINDGSCFGNLQIIADQHLPNYTDEILRLHPGAAVRAEGTLKPSPGQGQSVELAADEIKVLGFCDPETYPLGKQRVSFERLRELAHLRPRTNTFGAVQRVRNELAFATHAFFRDRGFQYVQTPIITASDCEGAGEMFQVTTLDISQPPRLPNGAVDYSRDFFAKPANLTVSGQLEGETYACALGNIYTFGPTFRAENSNTRRHLAEFWMIEPEMAFADLADDADLAEAYLRHLFSHVLNNCPDDLNFFNQRLDKQLLDTLSRLADSPFERVTYTEAVTILSAAPESFEFPVGWGIDLQSEHERYLTEQVFKGPVTVTDYPKEIKAFYMRRNDDGKTVAAMDVLLPRVGEIIGGSQREDRLDVLTATMVNEGLIPEDYWWYLDLRRFGSVPHAGFGLGFERMVQFCTGVQNIRDAIPFPRTPRNAEF
ncbi:MAG: asparagine--tRNA ligase [Lentisphaeria bacterium]|nr:asparagine--tRNA ligase [Lentisphaeria bacterium]